MLIFSLAVATALVVSFLCSLPEARQHLALVVDELGGTSGIVTMEGVLEELVGGTASRPSA